MLAPAAEQPLAATLWNELANLFDPERDPLAGEFREGITLRGANHELQSRRDKELLIAGPAGTGKTIAVLCKIHRFCLMYPGTRVLLLRQTRTSLTESVLELFENEILPPGHYLTKGARRENRFKYTYKNGSEIVCGGMDIASRIFSTRYTIIFVNEAFEVLEESYETLLRALRQFGAAPYRQLLLDTNPAWPQHWLKLRSDETPHAPSSKMKRLNSTHRDNPFYWDTDKGDWTPEGREYITETLGNLTGVRRRRLLEGIWAAAEGMIYEDYNPEIHYIRPQQMPPGLLRTGRRVWSFDFGYHPDPFVWQNWVVDTAKRMYLVREIYVTKRLLSDICKDIITLTVGEPAPEVLICDHDRQERAILEDCLHRSTTAAYKAIQPGLQAVMGGFKVLPDRTSGIYIVQGATWRPDRELIRKKRPFATWQEIEGYIWNPALKKGDAPIDYDNHGMDALRYSKAWVNNMMSKGGKLVQHRNAYGQNEAIEDEVPDDYLQRMQQRRRQ